MPFHGQRNLDASVLNCAVLTIQIAKRNLLPASLPRRDTSRPPSPSAVGAEGVASGRLPFCLPAASEALCLPVRSMVGGKKKTFKLSYTPTPYGKRHWCTESVRMQKYQCPHPLWRSIVMEALRPSRALICADRGLTSSRSNPWRKSKSSGLSVTIAG